MLSRERLLQLKTVYTVKEIATITGYSYHTIKNYLYDIRPYKNQPYVEITERNLKIKDLILEGETYESVGSKFNLTRQRIDQIVKRLGISPPNIERRQKAAKEKAKRIAEIKRKKKEAKTNRIMDMLQLVEVEGLSYNAVAKLRGRSLSSILGFCNRYNIKSKHQSLNPAYRK